MILAAILRGLFAAAENGGHHAGATPAVKDCQHSHWARVGHVGNYVFPNCGESQRTRAEIRPAIPLIGELHNLADCAEDFGYKAVRCVRAVLGNVSANFVDVSECLRMKDVGTHAGRRRRKASVFSIRSRKASSPSIPCASPLAISS